MAIGVLVLVVGGCFSSVMVHARPSPKEIVLGMFVPKLSSHGATRDAIALLGALIMPHNLFLHSALVISRKIPNSYEGIRCARKYFFIESGLALFIAFLVNVAVISVSGSVCSKPDLSSQNQSVCEDITLNSAAFLLKVNIVIQYLRLYTWYSVFSSRSDTTQSPCALPLPFCRRHQIRMAITGTNP